MALFLSYIVLRETALTWALCGMEDSITKETTLTTRLAVVEIKLLIWKDLWGPVALIAMASGAEGDYSAILS